MNMLSLIPSALAESAEAEPTWLQTAFEKVGEQPPLFWVLVAALVAIGVAGYALTRKKTDRRAFWTARTMAVGAMCIALSSVLSLVKVWSMPWGGSITAASMLPLLLFAYVYGAGPGVTLGALYGAMQLLLDGMPVPFAGNALLNFLSAILDYPLAFGLLGLAGFFRGGKGRMLTGFALGCTGRYVTAVLSGWLFYGQWAWEGWNPLVYSLVYNIAYMLPEMLICMAVAVLVGERLARELQRTA